MMQPAQQDEDLAVGIAAIGIDDGGAAIQEQPSCSWSSWQIATA